MKAQTGERYRNILSLTSVLDGVVSTTPRPLYPWEWQETGWVRGPVWTGAENLAPKGIRYPDCPVGSESLYQLSYPDPKLLSRAQWYSLFHCNQKAVSYKKLKLWYIFKSNNMHDLRLSQYSGVQRRLQNDADWEINLTDWSMVSFLSSNASNINSVHAHSTRLQGQFYATSSQKSVEGIVNRERTGETGVQIPIGAYGPDRLWGPRSLLFWG